MRTTIDLDSELLRTAKGIAAATGDTLSAVITRLAWKGLRPDSGMRRRRNGFPLLQKKPGGGVVTPQHVRELLEGSEPGAATTHSVSRAGARRARSR